jgi:hypothetical protein
MCVRAVRELVQHCNGLFPSAVYMTYDMTYTRGGKVVTDVKSVQTFERLRGGVRQGSCRCYCLYNTLYFGGSPTVTNHFMQYKNEESSTGLSPRG